MRYIDAQKIIERLYDVCFPLQTCGQMTDGTGASCYFVVSSAI